MTGEAMCLAICAVVMLIAIGFLLRWIKDTIESYGDMVQCELCRINEQLTHMRLTLLAIELRHNEYNLNKTDSDSNDANEDNCESN